MGDSPKWVKSKRRREKKGEKEEERLKDGENNGQATHGARKLPGPISIIKQNVVVVHSTLIGY